MNSDPSPENEALCTVTNENGWMLTLGFRHGTPESLLATDVCNEKEFHAVPRHLRTASWPVAQTCVTVQTEDVCILYSAEQVKALAQWLLAASIAMERMEEFDGFDAA
jgi:hypothetical protein